MSTTIFFYHHLSTKYKVDTWRAVFSQWYEDEVGFLYHKCPIDLAKYYQHIDYHEIIKDKRFMAREHWMMYHKALLFAKGEYMKKNLQIANKMLEMDVKKVKSYGRKVVGFNCQDWDLAKYDIVVCGNYLQFSQNAEMKQILLKTGESELVEAVAI